MILEWVLTFFKAYWLPILVALAFGGVIAHDKIQTARLHSAQETIAKRDQTIAEREQTINTYKAETVKLRMDAQLREKAYAHNTEIVTQSFKLQMENKDAYFKAHPNLNTKLIYTHSLPLSPPNSGSSSTQSVPTTATGTDAATPDTPTVADCVNTTLMLEDLQDWELARQKVCNGDPAISLIKGESNGSIIP
jgi:hypothetical protein